MTEIRIVKRAHWYLWRLHAKNGAHLGTSARYLTKFHCKRMAEELFPTLTIVDQTKDRRRRA